MKWLDDMKKKAGDEAGKVAAKAVMDQAQQRVEAMAEGLLSSGEEALQSQSAEVQERRDAMGLPDMRADDPDWAEGLDEASSEAYRRAKAGEKMPEGPSAEEKRAKALAQLAALKGGGASMLSDAQAALDKAAAERYRAEEDPSPTLIDFDDDEIIDDSIDDPFADVGDVLTRSAAARAAVPEEVDHDLLPDPEPVAELPVIDKNPLDRIEDVLAKAAAARGVQATPLELGPPEVNLQDAELADVPAASEPAAPPRRGSDPFAAAEALLARAAAARGSTEAQRPLPRATPDDPFSSAQEALRRASAARGVSAQPTSRPRKTELPEPTTTPDLFSGGLPSTKDPFAAANAALARASSARGEAKFGKDAALREAKARQQLAQLKRMHRTTPSNADTDPGDDDPADDVPKRRL